MSTGSLLDSNLTCTGKYELKRRWGWWGLCLSGRGGEGGRGVGLIVTSVTKWGELRHLGIVLGESELFIIHMK